ncbi:MAG: hypothetical protein NVSMB65_17550 [Chloroflexota bacterium]
MRVLTAEDKAFWDENGYVIVHDAVPRENLEALTRVIWEFLEMDPGDPASWYRTPDRANGMAGTGRA